MIAPVLSTMPNASLPAGFRKRMPNGDERASAAGILFVTPDGDALFLKRKGADHAGEYGLPAGMVEQDEEPADAARRESIEEVGHLPKWDLAPLHRETIGGIDFATFGQMVDGRFDPVLNDESEEYVWAPLNDPPEPLHPGLRRALEKFFAEEAEEPEHRSGSAEEIERALGKDASGVKIDRSHGVKWLSVMSRDGKTVFVDKGVPKKLTLAGATFDPAEPLAAHEEGEWARMAQMLTMFFYKEGRLPNGSERKAIYLRSHEEAGTVAEEQWFKDRGFSKAVVRAWMAWCRGKLAELENTDPANPPSDPDVKPFRHEHGALEYAGDDTGVLEYESGIPQYGEGDESLPATDGALTMALDRESVRRFDDDGRMAVEMTNLSKANVCPYRGAEIPLFEELGLDPDKVYMMWRHPDELRKSIPTWNGIQLLRKHVPVDADDHRKHDIVGTTGSNASFDGTYLRNSLFIWTREGIDLVESEEQKELSAGYHYVPVMEEGTTPDGEHFDGIMTEIRGNHIALVEEGRAGPDVMVADTAEEFQWAAIEHAILTLQAP